MKGSYTLNSVCITPLRLSQVQYPLHYLYVCHISQRDEPLLVTWFSMSEVKKKKSQFVIDIELSSRGLRLANYVY